MFFTKKSFRKTIQEIHDSFDIAADNALQEAKRILETPNSHDEEFVQALKKGGFSNNKNVLSLEQNKRTMKDAHIRASTVEKYSQKYPQYKFIFTDQVEDICKKYNLVCATVDKYKGDVPRKNAIEISKFHVSDDDTYKHDTYRNRTSEIDVSSPNCFDSVGEINRRKQLISEFVYMHNTNYTNVPFFICAPQSDFIQTENTKKKGIFLVEEVPDPIVLHFVVDGFLVVSKWGLEASEETLINQKMN